MARFPSGAVVFAQDGKRYIVEEVVHGVVYCHSDTGEEAEFPEAKLTGATDFQAQSGGRSDQIYQRIRQSAVYAPPKGKIDGAAAEQLLAKGAALVPGLLDFVAFRTATRAIAASGIKTDVDLSIIKCRQVFDSFPASTRVGLLADLIGAAPDKLVSAVRIGDNLLRAMIEKGLDGAAFEAFVSRRRD